MKLTYWLCERTDDSRAYSIRSRTKKEALKRLEEEKRWGDFLPPVKVIVEYVDAFDLVCQCLGEGGIEKHT